MENQLRTTKTNKTQDHEGSGGSDGAGDDNNISPRSLEQMQNISSGISKLVDDIVSPNPDKSLEQQMQRMMIGGTSAFPNEQVNDQACSIFEKGFGNAQQQNQMQSNDLAGSTPFPGYNQQFKQEYYQGQVQGVGDFNQPTSHGKHRVGISRYSSDDDCIAAQQLFPSDFQNIAVDGTSSRLDEKYSNSEYQESIDKYGHIFSSPEFQNQQQWQAQRQMIGAGGYQQYNTQNFNPMIKTGGLTGRANSFDKLVQGNDPYQQNNNLGIGAHNEDIETYSAGSGNHSAFSDGDAYNQAYQTPQQYFQGQNQQYMYQQPSSAAQSNMAAYGFTPNIQFTNSNQKHQSFASYGPPLRFMPDGVTPIMDNDVGEECTPNSYLQNDIQITGMDVNLQTQYGVTPRRGQDFGVQSNKISKMGVGQDFSDQNPHNHNQYKTPSPYRNSDGVIQYGAQQMGPYTNQTKNVRAGPNNMSDPFYPVQYQFKDQKIKYGNNPQPQYPPYRASYGVNTGDYGHIGMQAPPMLRSNYFHTENPAQYPMMGHTGPMVAIQQNIPGAQQINQYYPPQTNPPLLKNLSQIKTNSQERDPSYQTPNFIQPQQTVHQVSKTVVNTPTHNSDQVSQGSQNSNNSQQFAGLAVESNEKLLFSIIKQFDECQNPQQKLDIIRGNVHKLALTQTGSRFLQKQLTKANSSIVSFFLEEIQEHLSELMVDNYGNYFCQKLLSSCSGDQRLAILRGIQSRFIEICCNKKGTHTIQAMFELVNLPEEEEFIRNALVGNIVRLSKDAQGTHVVQKVMTSFEENKRQFIFEEIFDHFIDLSKNTNGLCVIKKLVQNPLRKDQAMLLIQKIQENAIDLVQDPFGNYAVTEVINNWNIELCYPVFNTLKSKICQLSNQKFSSNVIEKCLEKADETLRSQYIEEFSNSDKLTNLIRNSYGNYVVQKALKLAQGKDKQKLISAVQARIPEILDKKIKSKWEQIVQDAIESMNNPNYQPQNVGGSPQSIIDDNSQGGNNGSSSHRQVTVKQRTNSSDNIK